MKYKISGYRQDVAYELGLTMEDLRILRWIDDFRSTGGMVTKIIDGREYYWVLYEEVYKTFPILVGKNKEAVRTIKRIFNEGNLRKVLDRKVLNNNGTMRGKFTFFAINQEIYDRLTEPIESRPIKEIEDMPTKEVKKKKKEITPELNEAACEEEKEIPSFNAEEEYKPKIITEDEIEELILNFDNGIKPILKEFLKGKNEQAIKWSITMLKDKPISEQIRLIERCR